MSQPTDCRSEAGVTIGLVDGIIATCRVLVARDLSAPEMREALKDLRADEDLRTLLTVEREERS